MPFEVARHDGGHFEKITLKDFVCHFAFFLNNEGSMLAKLPKFVCGNKLDILGYVKSKIKDLIGNYVMNHTPCQYHLHCKMLAC